MKIAIIHFSRSHHNKAESTAVKMAKSYEDMGHTAHLVNGFHDINVNLTMCESIAIGIGSLRDLIFPSKDFINFFSRSGILFGKDCFVFHPKSPLLNPLLRRLNAFLAGDGIIITSKSPALTEKNGIGSVT